MLFHIEGCVENTLVFGLINMNSCSVTDYYARGKGIAKHHCRKWISPAGDERAATSI